MEEIHVKDYKNQEKQCILIFTDETELNKIDDIFANLITKRIYPLTKNIPFCKTDIKHCIEIFRREKQINNFTECSDCKLKLYCPYKGKNFKVLPIKTPNKDLIKWLKNENPSTRF